MEIGRWVGIEGLQLAQRRKGVPHQGSKERKMGEAEREKDEKVAEMSLSDEKEVEVVMGEDIHEGREERRGQ